MNAKTLFMATTLAAASLAAEAQDGLMTPETLWDMNRIGQLAIAPNGNTIVYATTHFDVARNKGTSRLYTTPLQATKDGTRTATELGTGAAPAFVKGDTYAFLRGGTLYVNRLGAGEGDAVAVAQDVDDFLFSPNGTKVILIRQVDLHPSIADKEPDLPEATGMVVTDLMYKHWDHYVTSIPHPFVGDFDGKAVTNLRDILEGEPYECPMEPFGGAEQLAWSPDGRYIAYTCRKKTGRDYAISTDSDIFLYDVEQGKSVANLCKPDGFTEPQRDPTVSLEHQAANGSDLGDCNMGYDLNPQFSPDGRYVAWLSMARDGYESDRQRLCVYDFASGEKRYVTEAFQSGVDEFLWAPDSRTLYFTGVWHGKVNVHRTDLDGHVSAVTDDQADYSLCAVTPDGTRLVVKRHSMQLPDDIYCITPGTGRAPAEVRQVTHENQVILDQLALGDVRERWVTTTDDKQMLCWVIYPPHFDPAKKYPALLFCEGGPQSPVSQFWSYRWNFQMMAARGYIVIAPNRRGLPGFGMEWLEAISGDYTGQCMQDYLSAIDDLSREPYVDRDRLGAVGASFGGFSVYWLAGNHNGRFKAFIAHDGIYNTQQQYVETEEMWFPNWDLGGAPWLRAADGQTRKAYAESPHLYVDRWDTPILCIHGQCDFRIEYTQAESAFAAARLRGLDAQLLLFPDENHWVLKPQNGILWQRTFFRFLDKHLK
ncbi:MAG: S9 family peptidase [Bacteroidaceae bacterium]|nr:S9 family peptidase [Bacteroidaceae bacterium]